MKKCIVLVVALMLVSIQGFSQFGVKGGLNFTKFTGLENISNKVDQNTGFHLGVLYKAKIPLVGITIQPELIYSQFSGDVTFDIGMDVPPTSSAYYPDPEMFSAGLKLHNLMLPVSLQWGLDLVLFRPFIQVVPYIGYVLDTEKGNYLRSWDINKFKYGVGLGAGIDVWKLQISGRYNWEMGKLTEWGNYKSKHGKNKGFELSAAFFF